MGTPDEPGQGSSYRRERERAVAYKQLLRAARSEMAELRETLNRVTVERDELAHRLAAASSAKPEPVDAFVVSFPKSGRTWLSYLYYHYTVQHLAALGATVEGEAFTYRPEERQSFMRALAIAKLCRPYPRLAFVHAAPGRGVVAYDRLRIPIDAYLRHPVVHLTRNPRDVAVSYYYHITNPKKGYDLPGDLSISEFLRSDVFGIRYIVEYMNIWAAHRRERHTPILWLTYEELMADAAATFTAMLAFLGVDDVRPDWVGLAVVNSSFRELKDAEVRHKLRSHAPVDDRLLRMRRGGSGTYHEYLSGEDIDYVEATIAEHLDPSYEAYRAESGRRPCCQANSASEPPS